VPIRELDDDRDAMQRYAARQRYAAHAMTQIENNAADRRRVTRVARDGVTVPTRRQNPEGGSVAAARRHANANTAFLQVGVLAGCAIGSVIAGPTFLGWFLLAQAILALLATPLIQAAFRARDLAQTVEDLERAQDRHLRATTEAAGAPPTVTGSRASLISYALTLDDEALRRTLASAPAHQAAIADEERQAAIDAYEAHVSDPDWRSRPAVEWMRREAELRSKLPDDYNLPEGVTR
jgi:hypothetical protein